MNEIKSVKALSRIYGLEPGDVLTRDNKEDRFSFQDEIVGDGYSKSRNISLSADMIDENFFVVIDRFEEKKEAKVIKNKAYYRNKLKELQEEALLSSFSSKQDKIDNEELKLKISDLERSNNSLKEALKRVLRKESYFNGSKLVSILKEKRNEYLERYDYIVKNTENGNIVGEDEGYYDEELTVLANLVKFIDGAIADSGK